VSFKDYYVFRSDRPSPRCGGRSIIIYKKYLNPIPYNTDQIESLNCDITMVSILNKELSSERI